MKHPAFDIPEGFFPFFSKYLPDSFMIAGFNVTVQVNKREFHPFRQVFSNRRFSGTHITYQKNTLHFVYDCLPQM